MLIYMDACCYSRIFDDQAIARNRLEADAVLAILDLVLAGVHELAGSFVVRGECSATRDAEKRQRVLAMLETWTRSVDWTAEIDQRGGELARLGFGAADALHIACAESMAVPILLTVDDRMLGAARRSSKTLSLRVMTPIDFLAQ